MAEERLANTSSTELYERLKVENMIVGWKSCTNIYLENMMISEVGKGKTNGKVEMCRGWLASWTPWPRDVKKDQSWPISWYRRAQNRFSSLFQLWPSGVLRVWIRHQGELGPDQRDHYGGPARCFGVSFSPDLKNLHCGRIISLLSTSAPLCLIVLCVSERPREGQLCHSPTKGFSQEAWSESYLFPCFSVFCFFCPC